MNLFEDLGFGIGLRTNHYRQILETQPKVDWFEALTENYLGTEGPPLENLIEIAASYPVVLHGVSLSIGGPDPIDFDYLKKLKELSQKTNARWVTDHLCWTGFQKHNTHDLLPMPYTQEALAHIVERICKVQEFLGQAILLENPSSYLSFREDEYSEAEFLREMSLRSGCGLLLDINNVFVSAHNHGYDAKQFIDTLPAEKIAQYHLAGHTVKATHILDTHVGPVPEDVWDLYRYTLDQVGHRSCLVEWDEDIPEIEVVLREAERAREIRDSVNSRQTAKIESRISL